MSELASLAQCFHGVAPAQIATCAKDGTPNITYLSEVHFVDDKHVALSCQFFNKTKRNVLENPWACVNVYEPSTFRTYQLTLKFERSETEGPLFDTMAVRVQAIASHTGMLGVFKLLSADVYEVVEIREIGEWLGPAAEEENRAPIVDPVARPRGELRGLQIVTERLNRARDLDELLSSLLTALRDAFGFEHSMVLLPEDDGTRLFAVASLGYGSSGIGAEVAIGEGMIGTCAHTRTILRFGDVDGDLRYGRAIRKAAGGLGHSLRPEIPLPGLSDARSHLALPLLVRDRLVGVLAVESKSPLGFDEWHEGFLSVVANHVAVMVEHMTQRDDEGPIRTLPAPKAETPGKKRAFCYYRDDECVFVDGEYLVRNVPAKILWKVLGSFVRGERTEFTNRELRMDSSLGLPPIKDNLESRLILLRKRLEERCPDVRMVPTCRGRFRLEIASDARIELSEKDHP